jgi:CheY-like chemotaxis protein
MADGGGTGARRVLVVDDSAAIRAAMQCVLSEEYAVVTAADGEVALRLIESGEPFDAILCDLDMPVVTASRSTIDCCMTPRS